VLKGEIFDLKLVLLGQAAISTHGGNSGLGGEGLHLLTPIISTLSRVFIVDCLDELIGVTIDL